MTTTVSPARLRPIDIGKPRMRGVLHMYAFFVAVISGAVLSSIAYTRPGVAPFVSSLVYSVTVCGLFGISALYHRRVWTERGYWVMRRLDHSMIFAFIAGTYTPFSVMLLEPRHATIILSVVWGGAVAGIALKLVRPKTSRWLSAPLYLLLGWVAIALLPEMLHQGGVAVLTLVVVGGLSYTVGAIFYALRRPNPWPNVFGHHEFFHACTLVAALCHQVAIYFALFV